MRAAWIAGLIVLWLLPLLVVLALLLAVDDMHGRIHFAGSPHIGYAP